VNTEALVSLENAPPKTSPGIPSGMARQVVRIMTPPREDAGARIGRERIAAIFSAPTVIAAWTSRMARTRKPRRAAGNGAL
jgi:hypothetical protein